jgi:phosphoadenosine phosphosulfate reductase
MMLTPLELAQLSEEFETKTPQEIIRWAVETFSPQLVLSSSFQTQSMPLLHMASRIQQDLPIFFLDTGYHFWETLIFRETIISEWHLNVINLQRDTRWDSFARERIRTLPLDDPYLCCFIHKVEPMQKALKDRLAWISGIRRDQTSVRAQAQILELNDDGLVKINPLLNWKKADVKRYMEEYNLPVHPLLEKGYRSIGCAPCTLAIGLNVDERAGRWAGRGKIECGLHSELFQHTDVTESEKSKFRIDLPEMNLYDANRTT